MIETLMVSGRLNHQGVGTIYSLPNFTLRSDPMRQDGQAEHGVSEETLFALITEDSSSDLDELPCVSVRCIEQKRLLSVLL